MKKTIYKVQYVSTYGGMYDDAPHIIYAEAPDGIGRSEMERLCGEKLSDFVRLLKFQKLEIVKLA